MNLKKIFFVLVFAVLLISCSSNSGDDLTDRPPVQDEVTYQGTVKAIIDNRCNSCHGSPTTNGAPFSLTTFQEVSARIDPIINSINNISNPMPPSGLMAITTRDLIQKWKDDGLLEN